MSSARREPKTELPIAEGDCIDDVASPPALRKAKARLVKRYEGQGQQDSMRVLWPWKQGKAGSGSLSQVTCQESL
jgi:hypothetical protein